MHVGGGFIGAAAEEIDGTGRVLTPGFIDIHTHFDPQLCWDGRADPSLQHGVTTVIIGNCSLSLAPVADKHAADRIIGMFGRIEDIKRPTFEAAVPFSSWYGASGSFEAYLDHIRPGLSINVGALVGHSAVRMSVMGEESQQREATPREIADMAALIEEAMSAGAIGVSSSYADSDEFGNPVPSRFSSLDEKCQLAAAMGRSGRGVGEVRFTPRAERAPSDARMSAGGARALSGRDHRDGSGAGRDFAQRQRPSVLPAHPHQPRGPAAPRHHPGARGRVVGRCAGVGEPPGYRWHLGLHSSQTLNRASPRLAIST